MSPMHNYLYNKICDIILSKTDAFSLLCFQCECQFGNKASCEWRHQYCGTFGEFGWHNIFLWKLFQSDVFISLDHRFVNQCYVQHIFSQYRLL